MAFDIISASEHRTSGEQHNPYTKLYIYASRREKKIKKESQFPAKSITVFIVNTIF